MQLNGSSAGLKYLASIYRTPEKLAELKVARDAARLADVIEARHYRPAFLPVRFLESLRPKELVTNPTKRLEWPVIVQGGISNLLGRGGSTVPVELNFGYLGEQSARRASTITIAADAIAGRQRTAQQGLLGMQDVFYFSAPLPVDPLDQLAVDLRIPASAPIADAPFTVEGHFTFTGTRVLEENASDATFTSDEITRLKEEIAGNWQREKILVVEVNMFTEEGRKGLETPEVDRSLLVLGVRSDFHYNLIDLHDSSGVPVSRDPFPISALAQWSAIENAVNPYRWFAKPIFLPRKQHLTMTISTDLAAYDADPATGRIYFLCKTT